MAVSASLAETEAQLGVTRDQLDVQSARSDALERENAALAAALEEATRDAEGARRASARVPSDAATARATELVESLEHQIEALRVEMDEERVTGGLKVEDASSRAEQLADQLQATQRTANKLAGELEAYRREAYDFDAKQALTNLQLKAAHEKVDALQEVVSEADAKAEARVREKASKIAELTKKVGVLASDKAALETRLEETEQRLELEVAGSLAAAKKKAMAMLDSYDVTQMSGDGGDPAQGELAMREALEARGVPAAAGRRRLPGRAGVFAAGGVRRRVAAGVRRRTRDPLLVQQHHHGDGLGAPGGREGARLGRGQGRGGRRSAQALRGAQRLELQVSRSRDCSRGKRIIRTRRGSDGKGGGDARRQRHRRFV